MGTGALVPPIDPAEIGAVVRAAIDAGHLSSDAPAVLFHDLGRLARGLAVLASAFPPSALHAVAIKANPVVGALRHLVARGAGLEAASFEELEIARAAGCPADRVVYDSPAKTEPEIARALERGVRINADNEAELARIDRMMRDRPSASRLGVRLNPAVGAGAIAATSVATRTSKFGIAIPEDPRDLAPLFDRYAWLTGVHVHVGSQGVSLEQLVAGARRAWDVITAVHAALGRTQVRWLDIGGGLPAVYRPSDAPPSARDWADALARAVPALFDGSIELVTEVGRALQAPCGFAISRVEHVKEASGERQAVIHVGADLFVRPTYAPSYWYHEIAVLDARGERKHGPKQPWTIVGPLCFAGDVLARDRPLPPIEPGDLVFVRDVGAYTLGMWSRHCSRAIPAVLGYEDARVAELRVLKPRETPEDVVRAWGG